MGFKKLLLSSGVYLAALVGIFTMLPLPDNVTFTKYSIAPEKPLTGSLALNEKLCGVSKHYVNKLKGPEGLLNHNNTLYTSTHYGHVLKLIDGQTIPVVKFGKECDGLHEEHICGRPLGMSVDKNGFLFVADAYYGIYKVNLNSGKQYGEKELIVSMNEVIDGSKPKLPNSVVVASDGIIYWTDSDSNYKLHDGLYTIFVDGTGRLIKYDPRIKKNTVLIKNLQLANGIALSEDESFILVAESWKFRLQKFYLKGPHSGKNEVFFEGLPGTPDNIKQIGKHFYIPLVMSRIPVLDRIGEFPTVRMMAAKFLGIIDFTFQTIDLFYPNIYCKKATHWVGHFESVDFIKSIITPRLSILKFNEKGTLLSSWHCTNGEVCNVCDIEVMGENLYLGSPFNTYLGVLKLPHGFL